MTDGRTAGQTDGRTHGHSIYRESIARAVKTKPLSDLVVHALDVITPENFGDDRVRVRGWWEVKFCHSPLTLVVVLVTLGLSHCRAIV